MSTTIGEFTGRYRFLSNFYPSPIRITQIDTPGVWYQYPTVEHAFQALKATTVADHDRVWQAPTPAVAKKLGRVITCRADWNEIRLAVMEQCVRAKFTMNDDLADLLRATGDATLIEGNWWNDRYWGVCSGTGENHLGLILMKVRGELQK